jgi:DNA-binding NtrC family response regulator
MTDYLETYEWIVDSASDFDSARRRLDVNHYAVVIADLRLSPKEAIAGLDVLAHVRTTSPETKTILLTAYGSPHVEEEARRLGVDAFLQKPKPLAELARTVFRVLGVEQPRE